MQKDGKEHEFRPSKLTIEQIAEQLGYGDKSALTQLRVVLELQHQHGLKLKSDQPLDTNAQLASDEYFASRDSEDMLWIQASENVFPVHTEGQPITLGPLHLVSRDKVSFNSFFLDETEYYVVDPGGMTLIAMNCDVDDLYADQVQIDQLKQGGLSALPPYADPESEYYAPELALAMELHTAIMIQGKSKPNLNRAQNVDLYLRRHYPDEIFEDAEIRRLSTVIGKKKRVRKTKK